MRWILAAALVVHGSAQAESRLHVTSDRAIVIVVNLVPYTFADGTVHTVDFKNGREGRQNVRVMNLIGQEVWSGQVDVPKDLEVKARWSGRVFEVYDQRPLKQAPAASRPAGLSQSGATKLDGLASNSSAPNPQEQALEGVEALVKRAPATSSPLPAEAVGAAPPPTGVPARLRLVNRTASWANVYVGDQKLEFRGTTDPVDLELPSGEHRVAIKDFQERESWGEGVIIVYPDFVVELHFSKNTPATVLNRPEAWQPDAP